MQDSLQNLVQQLAEEYLFNSTRELISNVLQAHSNAERIDMVLEKGREGSTEFWLDTFILLSVFIIVISLLNCVGRLCYWFCCHVPKHARDIDKIRDDKMDYQQKAKKEREERERTGAKTMAEELDEDFRTISQAMNEMRDYLRESEKAVREREQSDSIQVPSGEDPTEKHKNPKSGKEPVGSGGEVRRTRRKPEQSAHPVCFIRGLPSIEILSVSPNFRYLVIGSRAKRVTYVVPHPRMTKRDDAGGHPVEDTLLRAKDCLKKGEPLTIMEELPHPLPPSVKRVEIISAQFVLTDATPSILVAGERNTDAFYVYRVSGQCDVQLQQTLKMPNHRLVSSLTNWSVLSSPAGSFEALFHFQPKDCVVELLQPTSGTADGSFTSATEKFKVGNATAWCQQFGLVAVGGSFMREPRLCRVEHRHQNAAGGSRASQFDLKPVATLTAIDEAAGAGAASGEKLRVLAMALISPGYPSFNTRSYWIVWLENGTGYVYDLDGMRSTGSPEVVCRFTDTDYAAFAPEEPVRILTAVQGSAYKEKLVLLLVRGGNVTVYHQSGFTLPFDMVRRADLYQVLDGSPIEHVALLLNGRAMAVCGKEDHRGIRLFELPE